MIMRGMDVFLAFPAIVLALLIVGTVGPKLWLIVLAVGLGHVPRSGPRRWCRPCSTSPSVTT